MSGSRVYDPSKLHLKKELTQIRKAARVLRDPGTSSSWRSPLSSTRSAAAAFSALNSAAARRNLPATGKPSAAVVDKESGREREKKVFLYNWRSRSNKSSSERSLSRVDVDECLSDARNGGGAGDSKSDTHVDDILRRRAHAHRQRPNHGHGHLSTGFNCRESRVAPTESAATARKATGKVKLRKTPVSPLLHKQRKKRLRQVAVDKKKVAPSSSVGLSEDDSVGLIDRSDENEDYYGSEDFHLPSSAASPLLSRLIQKNFPQSSNKILRGSRRGDSSYTYSTPALSTSSFNRYFNNRNPSNGGSWDGTAASLNDVDDEGDDPLHLPGRQGCGIPCYWSRRSTPKLRGGYGYCSPSFSDTLRIKGSKLLCGSQKAHHKRHRSLSRTSKQRNILGGARGRSPLLNGYDGASSFGTGYSDDELSTNFGELDLEGMSRLDGRRWSASCRSQEGLEPTALGGDSQDESVMESIRSLSQRYRPIFFNEVVGQNMVVQSLTNAIARGRIAPVYLFQGPRGTGKSCTASIFAAALNCLSTEGPKPCGICGKCSEFISGRSRDIMEVDGTDKKGINSVRYVLKKLSMTPPSAISSCKVLVIDECHLLPSKTWAALLKFLEDPLPQVVFIFITTDLENVPRAVLSRCQKHLFNKIKDDDTVSRLQRIAAEEHLDAEPDALELIALNADGSLRDAETMLEQLSLLGKRITTALVNELVGIVSDEKLIELLELAMSSNTSETVKRARELLDSGADPLVLMSQLASLIMDIIAGNHHLDGAKGDNSYVSRRSLSDVELAKLKHALKLLSDAEKQLRVSSERSTWFTATLLQLGSVTSPEFTLSGSSRRQSSKTTDEEQSTASRDGPGHPQKSDAHHTPLRLTSPASLPVESKGNSGNHDASFLYIDGISSLSKATHNKSAHSVDATSSHDDVENDQILLSRSDMEKLDHLWLECIKRCHYEKLRQLLQAHGTLISISEVDGVLLAYIAFGDEQIKARAERYLISITNSFETVLRRSVEVRIIILPDNLIPKDSKEALGSPHSSNPKDNKPSSSNNSPLLDERSEENNNKVGSTKERQPEIPMLRIESIIREQRLETAWLQAAEKGTPSSRSCSRPERNQVLPQNQAESKSSADISSLNQEIKVLKVSDKKAVEKDHVGSRTEHQPFSPSLLHQSSVSQGYDSGPGGKGCNMLFCWNTGHPRKGRANQIKQVTQVQKGEGKKVPCFGERRKPRRISVSKAT